MCFIFYNQPFIFSIPPVDWFLQSGQMLFQQFLHASIFSRRAMPYAESHETVGLAQLFDFKYKYQPFVGKRKMF